MLANRIAAPENNRHPCILHDLIHWKTHLKCKQKWNLWVFVPSFVCIFDGVSVSEQKVFHSCWILLYISYMQHVPLFSSKISALSSAGTGCMSDKCVIMLWYALLCPLAFCRRCCPHMGSVLALSSGPGHQNWPFSTDPPPSRWDAHPAHWDSPPRWERRDGRLPNPGSFHSLHRSCKGMSS